MQPDVTTSLTFIVSDDNSIAFSGRDSYSSDPAKGGFDTDGNVDVAQGNSAWINFNVSCDNCQQVWYFTKLEFKDKNTGKWDGLGSNNALNSDEESDYSVIDLAEPIDQKTGVVAIPYDYHQVGFTLQDLNTKASSLDYRLTVSDANGNAIVLDPRIKDHGN